MKRRTLLKLAAASSVMTSAGLHSSLLSAQTAGTPRRGGTLKIALLGLDTADPHRHAGSIAVQQVYVETLTSIADDGTVKNGTNLASVMSIAEMCWGDVGLLLGETLEPRHVVGMAMIGLGLAAIDGRPWGALRRLLGGRGRVQGTSP